MSPKLQFAIAADYNGRWSGQMIADANRVASAVKSSSAGMANSMKAANLNTANLAAQFNDIGVMLASGQSPFLLALQQGTQVAQAIGPLGLAGGVKALGAAFLSVISPLNLVTIATIGLGAAAIQWLMGINQESPKAEEALKRHSDWLKVILTGYEGAAAAASLAVEAAQKLPQGAVESELLAKQREQLAAIESQFASISDLLAEFQAYAGSAEAFGVSPEIAAELAAVRDALAAVAQDGSLATTEIDDLVEVFTKLKNNTEDRNIREIASAALEMMQGFRSARGEIEATTASLTQLQAVSVDTWMMQHGGLQGAKTGVEALGRLTPQNLTAREQGDAIFGQAVGEARTTSEIDALVKAHERLNAELSKQEEIREAAREAKKVDKPEQYIDPLAARIKELSGVLTQTHDPFEAMKNDLTDLATLWTEGRISAEQYEAAVNKTTLGAAAATFGMVGKLTGAFSQLFSDNKALAVASAVINTAEGVTKALAQGGMLGFVGAASVAAAGAAQVATILSASKGSATVAPVSGGGDGGAAPSATPGQGVTIVLQGSRSSMTTLGQVEELFNGINDYLGAQGKTLSVVYKGA